MKGTSATFTADVARTADAPKGSLDPAKFAHPEPPPPTAADLARLPDDERLLAVANGVSALTFAGFGTRPVAHREGTVTFPADGSGTAILYVRPEWRNANHAVTVSGVLIDETGREVRATATIPLGKAEARGVRVVVPRELVAAGEPVPVAVEAFGVKPDDGAVPALIVVRLDANAAPVGWPYQNPDDEPDGGQLPALRSARKSQPAGWTEQPVFDPVRRQVVDTVAVVDGKAVVTLRHPGAYKLLALTRLADGTTVRAEAGLAARPARKLPGLTLALDATAVDAGGRLRGEVRTRFAGAKVLLTLRDAAGVKLFTPLTAGADGTARFDEPLPPRLRYGCAVTAEYPESAAVVHADQRELFVTPTDRTLAVTVKGPETAGPGADVKLDLAVNRAEPVDLLVSVYDESLLSVAKDRTATLRDFYLADARGLSAAARELALRRMGDVRIEALVRRAEKLVDDKDATAREPGLEDQLRELIEGWRNRPQRQLTVFHIATLVRLAGFEVYLAPTWSTGCVVGEVPGADRLADLFFRDWRTCGSSTTRVSAVMIDGVVLIGLHNREANGVSDPWAGLRANGQLGLQFGFGGFGNLGGQLGGSLGVRGISGFGGNIGGFGGIAGGFGGGGFGGQLGGQIGGLGGQIGMSFGHNRDFAGAPGLIGGGLLPGAGRSGRSRGWASAPRSSAGTSPTPRSGQPTCGPTPPARPRCRSSYRTRSPTGGCRWSPWRRT